MLMQIVRGIVGQIYMLHVNVNVYLEHPAGIGEHPQLQEEMRGQLLQLANAEDALGCLERHEKQLTGE